MDFVAIDVETANADFSSICQVGVASFQNGKLHDSWESLVDPEDYFDGMNVSIHGIGERDVRGAPKWSSVHGHVAKWINGRIVAIHTSFDRAAITRASEKNGFPTPDCTWLDTARVVRRTWPAFAHKGYGLGNVAKYLGINFDHHNAREDARAAGEILLYAVSESGLSIEQWLDRVTKPINPDAPHVQTRDGNPDGALYGEKLVFTGSLSMHRSEAADIASAAGCEVDGGVTKHTTLLVVGDQDLHRLAGHKKSSKHRKAEGLVANGQKIRIIGESDFQRLVEIGSL